MVNKTKYGIHKPKVFLVKLDFTEPTSYNQALSYNGWKFSMQV